MTFKKKMNKCPTLTASLESIYSNTDERDRNDTQANQNWILSIEFEQASLSTVNSYEAL